LTGVLFLVFFTRGEGVPLKSITTLRSFDLVDFLVEEGDLSDDFLGVTAVDFGVGVDGDGFFLMEDAGDLEDFTDLRTAIFRNYLIFACV
jgi:hypothetical protein